jgi:BMFP domain-containing protein YqiC
MNIKGFFRVAARDHCPKHQSGARLMAGAPRTGRVSGINERVLCYTFPTRRTAMLDPKTLEEIGNKMNALLANSPARDLEKNARAAVSGLLAKLDVVTREEFDIQSQVLARTRERLKELEARVEALEKARSPQ